MTRWPPHGPQSGEYGENYQQNQYGAEDRYGTYGPGENQGYTSSYQQPSSGAQSYYASNNEPYQPYPPAQPPVYGGPENNQSYPPQQPYGGAQGYPPYGQQYPPMQGTEEVDAFRSHFDQPTGPVNQVYPPADPSRGQVYPPPDPSRGQVYPPTDEERERGIMGAMAGAAAGGYGGHKLHHGFLGGVGGAIAGSMLEDAAKKHHEEKKYEQQQQQFQQQQMPQQVAGNFHASSRDVHLDDRCELVAHCADHRGHHRKTRIDLNDCLANINGHFQWVRGGNFAASARHISLHDDGRVLEAELGDGRGGWNRERINLNERISNEGGELVMI